MNEAVSELDLKAFPVLYVDDERANVVVFKHTFAEEFTVLTAQSAEEALEVLAQERVAVLLTDQRMPGATGVELAERVRSLQPEVVRMLITAYSDEAVPIAAINRGQVSRYVTKPWDARELAQVLRDAIEVHALKSTVERLRRTILESDRLALLGLLTSSVAHDLRTPLTCILGAMEQVEDEVTTVCERRATEAPWLEDWRARLVPVFQDARTADRQVRALLDSVRVQGKERAPERVELAGLVESTLRLCRSEVMAKARLTFQREASPAVHADPGQLGQIVLNLVVNAAQAITHGKLGQNEVTVRVAEEGERALLEIRDSGAGIPSEVLPRIFEPFFTTKEGCGGTGLGLAIVKDAVSRLGGDIHVVSQAGAGSRFTVRLPKA